MKFSRKQDSLRFKHRNPSSNAPLKESTNVNNVPHVHKPTSEKSTQPPPSTSSRVRKRTDSDCTIIPSTPRPHHNKSPSVSSPRPTKRRRDPSPPPIQILLPAREFPEIPDEDADTCLPPVDISQWRHGSSSPVGLLPEFTPILQIDSDPDEACYRPPPKKSKSLDIYRSPFGKPLWLEPSYPARKTLSSVLDVRFASTNPIIWDLGLTPGLEDSFVMTIQLRFRSWDLKDFDRHLPQALYVKIASSPYPRFQVAESKRAYEATYHRSPSHTCRMDCDSKDVCKMKGWRFKHGCWMFDMAWKVNANLFSPTLPTRRFSIQAEIKICDAIVTSEEKTIHVTNFTTQREMGGLFPTQDRLEAETVSRYYQAPR